MTKKRFKFRRFDVDVENINKISLYEIDNNPNNDLDKSNLFYVYSLTDANVQAIVDKLNSQEEQIKKLEKENELKGDFRNFINEDIVQMKKENAQLKQQKDHDFRFEYTKDFEKIDENTLRVDDTHTKIDCDGKKIKIMLNPPVDTKPYIFEYYITGVRFNEKVM